MGGRILKKLPEINEQKPYEKMGKPVRLVGVIPNFQKSAGWELAQEIQNWFIEHGVSVRLPQAKDLEKTAESPVDQDQDFYQGLDALIVLGGDGTLLRVARQADDMAIPILGVNLGHLGFLTELELPDLYPCLAKLVQGEYQIEERMRLEARIIREGQVRNTARALNDVVVSKGPLARIITLEVYINDQYYSTFSGDGLIIATPTGSTAYSLSAGGPIVNPELEVILLTPICPHTFYSRPLVVSPTQQITVVLRPRFDEVAITLDGQRGFRLKAGDQVVVACANFRTKLIKVRERHFFEIVREKIGKTR